MLKTSTMLSSKWLSLVLLLTTLAISQGFNTSCHFPDYLQRDFTSWKHKIQNQGKEELGFYHFRIMFDQEWMLAFVRAGPVFSTLPQRPYKRRCIQNKGDEKFIVSHQLQDSPDQDTRYCCLQFQRKSPYVVLLRESRNASDIWGEGLCDDSTELIANPWPMVPSDGEIQTIQNKIPAPLVGGYAFGVRLSDSRTVCDLSHSSPRMEIGCAPYNRFTLDFLPCPVPQLYMSPRAHLDILGEWDVESYHFLVLAEGGTSYLWCLRLPYNITGEPGYLFLDVRCDPEDPTSQNETDFLQLDFQRRAHTSLCHDLSPSCEQDVNSTDIVCRSREDVATQRCLQTCDACSHVMERHQNQSYCLFDDYFLGRWLTSGQDRPVSILNINSSDLAFDQSEGLSCWFFGNVTNTDSRYPLLYTTTNGCFPSFTCIEFKYLSYYVTQFRLTQTTVWPGGLAHVENPLDLCKDSSFIHPNSGRAPDFQNLVRYPESVSYSDTFVDCGMAGEDESSRYNFFHMLQNGVDQCQGEFQIDCDNPTVINVDQQIEGEVNKGDSPCRTLWPSDQYACYATFTNSDNDRVIILRGNLANSLDDVTYDVMCWVFPGDSPSLMYSLPWVDCHPDTLIKIKSRDITSQRLFGIQKQTSSPCALQTTATTSQTSTTVEFNLTTFQFSTEDGSTLGANSIRMPAVGILCVCNIIYIML